MKNQTISTGLVSTTFLKSLEFLLFAALTINLTVSVNRDPLYLLFHYLICFGVGLALVSVTIKQWTDLPKQNRQLAVLGLLVSAAYCVLSRELLIPNTIFFVFVAGSALCISALTPSDNSRNTFKALLWTSVLFAAAKLSDELFLWSAYLTPALLKFVGMFGVANATVASKIAFSYLAGWFWILILSYGAFCFLETQGKRRLWFLLPLAIYFFAMVLHLGEQNFVRLWLFGLASCLICLRIKQDQPSNKPSFRPVLIGGVLSSVGMVFAFHLNLPKPQALSKVVMLEGAYSNEIPDAQDPKRVNSAAMGYFAKFVERSSSQVNLVKELQPAALQDARVLFLCNLARPLSQEEIQTTLNFVENGGSLFLLGDHTNIFGVRDYTNPLISNFGVNLNFDSAMPHPGPGWFGAFDTRWANSTCGLATPDLIQISVGASLDFQAPSRPLIVARSGFGDDGDAKAPQKAFLGNWAYDAGTERLGDLVLATECGYGKGHVVIFGDTAFLQESSFSLSWTFVAALLADLNNPGVMPSAARQLVGICLALLGLLLVVRSGVSMISVLALLLSAVSLVGIRNYASARNHNLCATPSGVAWLDFKNGSNVSLHGQVPNALDGFTTSLASSGYVPLLTSQGAPCEPADGDVKVFLSGRAPIADAEFQESLKFCERGGRILSFVGAADQNSYRRLTENFGVQILDEPLGICPAAKPNYEGELPSFYQAWALGDETATSKNRRLISCWEKPVVLEVSIGHGFWYLISDPQFPWDRNFKIGEEYRPANFRFVNALLGKKL